ncbi:MAG: homoserine O-acetyltransferase [Bacteroidota bacterium]
MSGLKNYHYPNGFELENGQVLEQLNISYHTYGTLNEAHNNVVWICHALTANSDVSDWWKGFVGTDAVINPDEHFIVCANILGSHYGTTGPLSTDPKTGNPYFHYFPEVTIRDMVKAHQLLAAHLGIKQIELLIGGSLGGQQALEWSVQEPRRISKLLVTATNARHSPWGIAFNESQRLAILADRSYYSQKPDGGSKGLRAARSIALLSYRNYRTYSATQNEETHEKSADFRASSYQRYQGDKLVNRFNAYSYIRLGQAMDSHNLGRGRGGLEKALSSIKAKTLVVGIDSDLLFPIEEQQYLAKHITGAVYAEIPSLYGHDGFLLEISELTKLVKKLFVDEDHNTDTPHTEAIADAVGVNDSTLQHINK